MRFCINQADVEERSGQVAIMHDIYGNTVCNLIWLGEADESTETALAGIKAILGDMRTETNNFQDANEMLFQDFHPKWSSTGISADFDAIALAQYYSSPWFLRLWIVQEATLAPVSVCYRGKFETPLEEVLKVTLWIRHKFFQGFHLQVPFALQWGLSAACTIADMADDSGRYRYFHHPPSLLNILVDLQEFSAYEPKDRIYAALGLLQRFAKLQSLPPLLMPDYSKPLGHVLRDTTVFGVLDHGNLEILRYVSHRLEELDSVYAPTWVPRWDRKRTADPCLMIYHCWSADAHVPAAVQFSSDDSGLMIAQGRRIGSVDRLTEVMPTDSFKYAGETSEIFDVLTAVNTVAYNTDLPIQHFSEQALAVILTGGCNSAVQREDPQELLTSGNAFLDLLNNDRASITGVYQLTELSDDRVRRAASYLNAMWYTCASRRFFAMSPGYFGVGPQTMRPGDTIAVLYGGSMPFVLRPLDSQENEFEFVGDCFVHGIMDGEAVEAQKAEGIPDVVFRLR